MITCVRCSQEIGEIGFENNFCCCTSCGYHFPLPARKRIELTVDPETFEELAIDLKSSDPLGFVDLRAYPERLKEAIDSTGLNEAIICGEASIRGVRCVLAVMDFSFLGGSMGSVVGEKFALSCRRAVERRIPLVVFTASGGARMQEGLISLMQMAKTIFAVKMLHEAGVPFITVLTNPTTGGVYASFATQADIIISEPDVLVCFAGPRVIKQTIGEDVPEGFGGAEFCLSNGLIDLVVERRRLREVLGEIMSILTARGDACEREEAEGPLLKGDRTPGRRGKAIEKIVALSGRALGWVLKRLIR